LSSDKNAALDALATFRALRNGNTGLAQSIAERHRSDAGALLQHTVSIALAFLNALDNVCTDHGVDYSSEQLLDNLQNGILLHDSSGD
jgi:hypothetical protein